MIIPGGHLVEIGITVLKAGQRASGIPEETQKVDLEMRVKGVLKEDARLGETVEIRTPAGRVLRGTLLAENPPYTHHFGSPIPELVSVGGELRALLAEAADNSGDAV